MSQIDSWLAGIDRRVKKLFFLRCSHTIFRTERIDLWIANIAVVYSNLPFGLVDHVWIGTPVFVTTLNG